jgi:hypothetical protein
MAGKHETVVSLAQMVLSKLGARVFKNQMGSGFVGRVESEYPSSAGLVVEISSAARVKFGVCNPGGSDLIGWRPLKITSGMVGQTVAQFLAVECKTPAYNRASEEQKRFMAAVVTAGGIALIARREGEDGVGFEEVGK